MATSAVLPAAAPVLTAAPSVPTMGSVSEMLSSLPPGIFDGIDSISPDGADTTPDEVPAQEPDVIETQGPETPTSLDEPPADEPPAAVEDESPLDALPDGEAPPAEAAVQSDLPDGVAKGKNAKGKAGYFVDENRWNDKIYPNHKLVQEAGEILLEPLTVEALKLRNDAYLGQERMFNNLTSGDPAAQGEVIDFIFGEMAAAHEEGATGVDPTVPFAAAMYNTIKEKSPDAYATLRMTAARDLLSEMYQEAAVTGDEHLFSSAQRMGLKLAGIGGKPETMTDDQYLAEVRRVTANSNIPFHATMEMENLVRPEDPVQALQRENAELRARANGNPAADRIAQFKNWDANHATQVKASIFEDGIKPQLASAEAAWSKFPKDYQSQVLDPLQRQVTAAINGDPNLNQRVKELQAGARRATSPQVRDRIGNEIKQLVVNRARIAAEKLAPSVLKTAADWLAFKSQKTHERLNGAQTRSAPQGTSTPVRRSAVPETIGFKDGFFDTNTAVRQALSLMR